jgi:molecular chaperone DnaK (HSP70)
MSPIDEKITRKEFQALIVHYLARTIECTKSVMRKAELTQDEIDLILLVGGSARGPWVSDALASAFPHTACELFEPDLCVAAGAALYAKMVLSPLVQSTGSALELLLDVPESIAIDQVQIRGQVSNNLDSYDNLMAVFSGDEIEGEQRKVIDTGGGVYLRRCHARRDR